MYVLASWTHLHTPWCILPSRTHPTHLYPPTLPSPHTSQTSHSPTQTCTPHTHSSPHTLTPLTGPHFSPTHRWQTWLLALSAVSDCSEHDHLLCLWRHSGRPGCQLDAGGSCTCTWTRLHDIHGPPVAPMNHTMCRTGTHTHTCVIMTMLEFCIVTLSGGWGVGGGLSSCMMCMSCDV